MEAREIQNRVNLGDQLRSVRESQGWSVEQVAKMADITECNVRKIEDGRYNVPMDIICRLADVLNCKLELRRK